MSTGSQDGERPIDRLRKMNPKAIEFFESKGIDLYDEPLEVAVCAQHMNGGIDVDCNWQTSVENLFAVGETAGTFGMYRPGGSALNSTQVGGLRIAEYISAHYTASEDNAEILNAKVKEEYEYIQNCLDENSAPQTDFSAEMSDCAAHCRVYEEISALYKKLNAQLNAHFFRINNNTFCEALKLYKYKDNLEMQTCLCKAMLDVLPIIGSRGGAIYYQGGAVVEEDVSYRQKAVVTHNGKTIFENLRPAPSLEYNFEQTWQKYCKVRNI